MTMPLDVSADAQEEGLHTQLEYMLVQTCDGFLGPFNKVRLGWRVWLVFILPCVALLSWVSSIQALRLRSPSQIRKRQPQPWCS